ncbi:MAG: hypothetical protein WDZ93_02455 [Candidatus Paceibacterota bacterium]
MTPTILPAPIPRSSSELIEILSRVSFASAVQIDVVDGIFATPPSWPYEPVGSPHDVAEALSPFDAEVDLMAYEAVAAAREWHDAGVRRFIFHIETLDGPDELVTFKSDTGAAIGCSLSNDTPLSALDAYLPVCDFVQLMGIARIGVQSEPFDERVLLRIQQLKAEHPDLSVMVDGSVNAETLPALRDAGADRFAVGSAILAADDPKDAYDALSALV